MNENFYATANPDASWMIIERVDEILNMQVSALWKNHIPK